MEAYLKMKTVLIPNLLFKDDQMNFYDNNMDLLEDYQVISLLEKENKRLNRLMNGCAMCKIRREQENKSISL